MPGGDGTGPWWAQGQNFRCWRRGGYGRGFGFRYWQGYNYPENLDLSRDEQIKILKSEILELEKDKQELQNKIKELENVKQ